MILTVYIYLGVKIEEKKISKVFPMKLKHVFDLGKCHCRMNLHGSSLIKLSSIAMHVVRVGMALTRSIRVDLRSILTVEAALGSSLSIWVHVICFFIKPLQ